MHFGLLIAAAPISLELPGLLSVCITLVSFKCVHTHYSTVLSLIFLLLLPYPCTQLGGVVEATTKVRQGKDNTTRLYLRDRPFGRLTPIERILAAPCRVSFFAIVTKKKHRALQGLSEQQQVL